MKLDITKIEVVDLKQRKKIKDVQLNDPKFPEFDKPLSVYQRFSQIREISTRDSNLKFTIFLAVSMTDEGEPDKVFACPIDAS